ncbi:MAG: hypothetical protein JWM78_2673 [Verrucomicrobiaceae bacterium]|nr:hypothetical protein [Verrucomicrobiaceae bacterium]
MKKIPPSAAMLFIAVIIQNISSGTAYSGYGIAMHDLIDEFGISRSTGALGSSILAVVSAFAAPLSGKLIDRWSLRKTVLVGAVIGALGLTLASFAPNFIVLLIGFSLMGGLGNTFCGSLPSSSIASRWFPQRTGMAVAVCMLPIMVTVGTPAFGWIITQVGWRGLFGLFAGLYVFALLPAAFIRDFPPGGLERRAANAALMPEFKATTLLRQSTFWCLVIGIGILFSAAITLVSHVVSAAVEVGVDKPTAAFLVSMVGVSAAFGGLGFGWLGDRIGAGYALVTNALLTGIGWLFLSVSTSFATMAPCVILIGICTGSAVVSPLSAYIAHTYGRDVFGRVFGLLKQFTLPLLFAGPVVIGALYDFTHSYRVPFLFVAALCGLSAALLFVVQRRSAALPVAVAI